ncbi:hypothetical protein V3C99_012400 [Haemonchus contortus]|uniref:PAZ domain-containing protein n=1 Tax=Haemonchus contortus TaxID=6289 RepID=A0A7I4Y5E9_HAECO
MDLLDNITSMMNTTSKELWKSKPRPVVKKEVKTETPESSPVTPKPSFRIPKKTANAQSNASSMATGSPLARVTPSPSPSQSRPSSSCRMEADEKLKRECKDEPRGYTVGRSIKQEYKPGVDTRGRCDFVVPRTLAIEMNGVTMDLSHAPEFVNRYHINITKVKRNGDEKDATRGPKQDLPSAQRKQALFALFGQVVSEHPEFFGENSWRHVYDLGNTFYSIGCKIKEDDGDVVFEMTPDAINCKSSREFFSRGCSKLIITVQWTGKIYIKGPKQNEDDGTRREAARFFEILTSQSIFSSDHHVFANKFFEGRADNDVKLGEGKCVKSGFEKNVRFLGNDERSAVPVLQIDTKKSPFYRGQSVLDFIRELTNRDPDEALKFKPIRQKVARELRDLVVSTTHQDKNTWFYIHGIVDNSARNQMFETDEGEISVEEYFKQRYKRSLRYPHLPLATERKGKGFSFYPLEVLCIERGQRVDNKKLAGKLTDKMIQQARMLPHQMREHNLRQLHQADLVNSRNEYLAAFGVNTSNDFVKSEAKVLCAPEIKYKTSAIQPDRSGTLQWRMNSSVQFYQPATVKDVSLVIFDRAVSNNDAMEFYRALARAGRERGMVVQDNSVKVTNLSSELDSEIEEHFRSCAGKVSMIMCITADKKDPVHDFVKLLEARHKVLTQHVSRQTAQACSGRGGAKTLENVLLKFNVKNGGVNHIISAARAALGGGTTQQDINGRLFNGKMFVGFELSHAAAQSFYDRQVAEKVKEPTVVGFSYSVGQPTDYSGFWWYQEPRLHNILYLQDHFRRAFHDYHKKNKRLPVEVMVYRSGTSEGEFAEVGKEASDIRAVAERMADLNGGRPYHPKITIIVAQTNSNYRIMPASMPPANGGRMRASDFNVPSGTCADTGITHPRLREFIMTSQQANIGTSRPTRYTIVVEDKPQMSLTDAEHITHFLCHGHQQSTLPTHVPAVLYAAENLAKRGRAAWKTKLGENSDGASSSASAPQYKLADGEDLDGFYKRISRELMNSLPNQYFA